MPDERPMTVLKTALDAWGGERRRWERSSYKGDKRLRPNKAKRADPKKPPGLPAIPLSPLSQAMREFPFPILNRFTEKAESKLSTRITEKGHHDDGS